MPGRYDKERTRRRSYRKEVAREEEQVDVLLEKAEQLRSVADDFIKAWEDLHDDEFDYDDDE